MCALKINFEDNKSNSADGLIRHLVEVHEKISFDNMLERMNNHCPAKGCPKKFVIFQSLKNHVLKSHVSYLSDYLKKFMVELSLKDCFIELPPVVAPNEQPEVVTIDDDQEEDSNLLRYFKYCKDRSIDPFNCTPLKVNNFINYAYETLKFSKMEIRDIVNKISRRHLIKDHLANHPMVKRTLENLIQVNVVGKTTAPKATKESQPLVSIVRADHSYQGSNSGLVSDKSDHSYPSSSGPMVTPPASKLVQIQPRPPKVQKTVINPALNAPDPATNPNPNPAPNPNKGVPFSSNKDRVFLCITCRLEFPLVRFLSEHFYEKHFDLPFSIGCKFCGFELPMSNPMLAEKFLVFHTFSAVHLFNRHLMQFGTGNERMRRALKYIPGTPVRCELCSEDVSDLQVKPFL